MSTLTIAAPAARHTGAHAIPKASITVYVITCAALLFCIVAILVSNSADYRLFGTYWASGNSATHGLNPYAAYPLTFRFHPNPGDPRLFTDLNLSPPCLLPLFQLLAHLSVAQFRIIASLASWLLFAFTAGFLLWHNQTMQKRQIVWLLFSAAVFDTLTLGQIYGLFFFLAAFAWISLAAGHEWRAAIAIGLLLAIRPTLLFWPAFLYLAGHRRLALRSIAAACITSTCPMILYGPHIYREWVAALANDAHGAISANIAILPFFDRLGLHGFGVGASVILACALAWTTWKRKPDASTTSAIALGAWLLCAPLSWVHYTIVVSPWFIARRWSATANVAAGLLMVPIVVIARLSAGSALHMAITSGIYFIAIGLMLGVFLSQDSPVTNRTLSSDSSRPKILRWSRARAGR